MFTDVARHEDLGNAMVRQPDGRLVVAGSTLAGSNDVFALARYLPDGHLDTTFGHRGVAQSDVTPGRDDAFAVALQDDGSIVATGMVNGYGDVGVARYLTDGGLDPIFGSGGLVSTSIGSSEDGGFGLAIGRDGRIVVAGHAFLMGNDVAVLRYLSA
jgi:uncharacterized delta-60 repeat protein